MDGTCAWERTPCVPQQEYQYHFLTNDPREIRNVNGSGALSGLA